MFHGVLGTSSDSVSLTIAHPKYEKIKKHTERFLKLLEALASSDMMGTFPSERQHLANYIATLSRQVEESFCAPDLEAHVKDRKAAEKKSATPADAESGAARPTEMESLMESLDYTKISAEVTSKFTEVFQQVKSCNVVNTIIVTCKNLTVHKKSIATKSELRDKFLLRPPMTFSPLEGLPVLNVKHMYINDRLSPEDKKFILLILHKMYTISHDVYEAVSSPDINVDDFATLIMDSIGDVKKQIPRCDGAFDKIVKSIDLLKGNFSGYYKDYVASNNPTIIMENFVIDVSKSTKSSPQITSQFRRIIMHYRKISSESSTNPKLQTLFKKVDQNFQELEKKDREADGEEESEESDSETGETKDDSGAPAAAPAAPLTSPAKKSKTAKKNAKNRLKKRTATVTCAAPTLPEKTPLPSLETGLAEELDELTAYVQKVEEESAESTVEKSEDGANEEPVQDGA